MKRNRLVIVGVTILAFVFILMPVVSNNAWAQQVAQAGGAGATGTAAGAGAAGAGGAAEFSTAAIVGIVAGAALAIALVAAATSDGGETTPGHATAGH